MADERDLKHFAEMANENKPKFKFENSMQLALVLDVKHNELMKFYWYLENQIVKRRHLIRCCLVVTDEGNNFIKDMSDAFILAAFVHFGKKNSLTINDF